MIFVKHFFKPPTRPALTCLFGLIVIGMFLGAANNLIFSNGAYANNIGLNGFCDDDDADPQKEATSGDGAEGGGCLLSNYVRIPEEFRPTRDEFLNLAVDCKKNNSGRFTGIDGGACMNALRSCYELVLDKEKCKDTSDGGLISRIGNECGSVVGSGGDMKAGDDCNSMSEANTATLDDVEASYRNKLKTCETKPLGKERNDCYDVFNRAVGTCAARAGLGTKNGNSRDGFDGAPLLGLETNDGGYNSMDLTLDQYDECLRTETLKKVTDPSICGDLGGIYINKNTKDPNGPNTLDKGCYNQASDLTNPEACALANKEFSWVQTGGQNTPDKKDDAYGCEDMKAMNDACVDHDGLNPATGKCNDGSVPQQPSPTTRDTSYDPTKQCGKVQTILISCDKNGEGLTTLGNVLKIAIQALSVLVGIAAVGGIAWASVLYAKAQDSESDVQQAKELIRNVVIGIILYAFMIAIIGWLVPGSVIS